ncbi:MAG: hypothetical protein Kapaf2KO_19260 [Candidatus Kapaibacteriales bacterium]
MRIIYYLALLISGAGLVFGQSGKMIINLNNGAPAEFQLDMIDQMVLIDATIEVTGLQLSVSDVEIKEGETYKIDYTISPENATDKTITWMSSNENVATVDLEGVVLGVGVGKATITGKTTDGGFEASMEVDVLPFSSVEELKNEINIFPNPTSDMVRIDMEMSGYEVVLTSVNGAVLFTGYEVKEVDLSGLANGAYSLTIIVDGNYLNYQIIKK